MALQLGMGYYPSGSLGFVLIILLVLVSLNCARSQEARQDYEPDVRIAPIRLSDKRRPAHRAGCAWGGLSAVGRAFQPSVEVWKQFCTQRQVCDEAKKKSEATHASPRKPTPSLSAEGW
jgi:Protein of unknown function (DUF3309)